LFLIDSPLGARVHVNLGSKGSGHLGSVFTHCEGSVEGMTDEQTLMAQRKLDAVKRKIGEDLAQTPGLTEQVANQDHNPRPRVFSEQEQPHIRWPEEFADWAYDCTSFYRRSYTYYEKSDEERAANTKDWGRLSSSVPAWFMSLVTEETPFCAIMIAEGAAFMGEDIYAVCQYTVNGNRVYLDHNLHRFCSTCKTHNVLEASQPLPEDQHTDENHGNRLFVWCTHCRKEVDLLPFGEHP